MKKIKKNILDAVNFYNENNVSLTKAALIFNIDRHILKDYTQLNFNKNNFFKNDKYQDYIFYFTDDELLLINYCKNNQYLSYNEIKNKFNFAPDRRTIINWMEILGIDYYSGPHITYHYDRNKFKNIETEEDAYWLGFITADGCIIENKHLQIKLSIIDKHHIEKFCKYIGLSDEETKQIIKEEVGGAYTKDNKTSSIRIASKDIVQNLIDKGITFRKSGKEHVYKCSTKQLEKAYIRGIIDGDGYLRKDGSGIGVCGSYEICSYIKNFINENIIDTSNNSIYQKDKIFGFSIGGALKSSKIARYLYEDSNIYLDRKFNLYQEKYCCRV